MKVNFIFFAKTISLTCAVFYIFIFLINTLGNSIEPVFSSLEIDEKDNINNIITDDRLVEGVDYINADSSHTSTFVRVIELSSELERCRNKLTELDDEKNKHINQFNFKGGTFEDLESALTKKINENEITKKQAYSIYSSNWKRDDERKHETLTKTTLINIAERNEFLNKFDIYFSKLLDNIYNDSELSINDSERKKIRVFLSNKFGYASFNTMLIDKLSALDESVRNKILLRYRFDSLSIDYAIRAKLPTRDIIAIIKNSEFKNDFYDSGLNGMQKILLTSLKTGNEELTKFLVNEFPENSHFIPSSINVYVNDVARSGVITEADDSILRVLSALDLGPMIYRDGNNGSFYIEGFNNTKLTGYFLDKIKYYNFKNQPQKTNTTDVRSNVKFDMLIDNYIMKLSALENDINYNEVQCKKIKNERIKLEPKFLNNSSVISEAKKYTSYDQGVSYLSKLSPTLVDLYTNEVIQNPILDEVNYVQDWINENKHVSFNELIEYGNSLQVNQQNYLFAKKCKELKADQVVELLNQSWAIDINNSSNASCFTNDIFDSERLKSENRIPSKIYFLVKNAQYSEALQVIRNGDKNFNGFHNGRDGLALLLDRIIHFHTDDSSIQFTLLERFLDDAKLNDNHFSQLKRLQLKHPNYYTSLLVRYPELKIALKYKPSKYSSYI